MIYYLNGKHVKMLDANLKLPPFKKAVLVKEVESFGASATLYEYAVEESDLQPIVTSVFDLGDTVKHVNSEYVGIVTGFELKDNLVVTKPKYFVAQNFAHMRYAHSVRDVVAYSRENHMFRSGHYYKLCNNRVVLAVTDPNDDTRVHLVNGKGVTVYSSVPKEISFVSLAMTYNITSVTLSNQGEWTL